MPDEALHEQQQAAEGAAADAAGSGGKQQDGTGLVGQRRPTLTFSLHTHTQTLCKASSRCHALVPNLQLLPLARVKKMMKEAEDVKTVATDASWAVARATVSCWRLCRQTAEGPAAAPRPGAALTNANIHPAFVMCAALPAAAGGVFAGAGSTCACSHGSRQQPQGTGVQGCG